MALHWFLKPREEGAHSASSRAGDEASSVLFGSHRGSIPLSQITQMNIMGGGVLHISTEHTNYKFKDCPEHHKKLTSSWSPKIDR